MTEAVGSAAHLALGPVIIVVDRPRCVHGVVTRSEICRK
jgi:hypothetical protein